MLRVKLAVTADAANISREGKLNITGIFNNINTTSLPAVHPWMTLVFVLEGERSDAQSEHKLKIDLIDADGARVMPPIEGNINFGDVPPRGTINAYQIIQLAGIPFSKPGRHEFKIIINGEERISVPMDIAMLGNQGK